MVAPVVDPNYTILAISSTAPTAPSLNSAATANTLTASRNGAYVYQSTSGYASPYYYGGRIAFPSAVDLSSTKWLTYQRNNEVGTAYSGVGRVETLANNGHVLLIYDGSGNWSKYQIHGNDTVFPSTYYNRQPLRAQSGGFDINNHIMQSIALDATPDQTSGTLDLTDVAGVEYHTQGVVGSSSGTGSIYQGAFVGVDYRLITDGDLTTPGTFSEFFDEINVTDAYHFYEWYSPPEPFSGLDGNQYIPYIDFQIGDGTTATRFDDANFALGWFPIRNTVEISAIVQQGTENRWFTINQSASDVVILDTFTISARGDDEWGFRVQGSTSGSCTVSSGTFFRPDEVILGHGDYTNITFDQPTYIQVTTDTTCASCILKSSQSGTDGIFVDTAAGDYSAVQIQLAASNSGNDLTIDPPGGGTWDFTGLTVESGHTLAIRNDSATQAITVEIAQGITYSTSTAGGTVAVTQPTATFTINSSETGSLIQIFTTSTQTVLDSATGSSLAFTHSGQTVDYVIQKAGFIPQRFTGVVLSGTTSVTVNLVPSREYDASHGLTYTTDASWSRTNNELTVPTYGVTGQGVFSLMMDSFISEAALRNTDFNLEMDGAGSLFLTNDAEGNADSSIENITRCGVGYITTAGVDAAQWVGVLSIGDNTTGETGEYQQIDGTTTTDARTTGDFDELIKIYGDSTHGNFDYRGHLVLKYQINGYSQVRVDVLDLFGLTALVPALYVLPMSPQAITASTGDPAISITITDHTAAPITVGGELFDYEVVDNGTNSAEAILREINYNNSLDATYQGKDPFNWPNMVVEEGSAYATAYGYVEGQDTTTTLHGFYVSRSSADHPDFARFQANNGNYYTVPVSDDLVVNSSESASQIIVFSTGTQTEIDSEASASSLTYTHSNETVDITVMKAGFIPFRQTGVVLSGDVTITANLVASREYDASHGLTYTTDASWASNQLTVPTFGPSGQGVFSLMIDSFISESALRNTAFNLEMDGAGSLYLVNDAEGASDATPENITSSGTGYISTAGVTTAEWCSVLSVGTATGFQGEFQQIDGSTTTDARATGVFNQAIKTYGDASHGNFDYRGHLVLKYQVNGYYQSRSDVLATYGISALTPSLYIIAMEPAATGVTTGDPAISITITDHTAAPITVGGLLYDYEIVDNGTNSAEDILREINYNLAQDATYQGKDPFNYPDMVIESGGNYETQRDEVDGQDTTTTLHGFYVSRSSADHPGFARFQANDGSYYTPAVTSDITITGMSNDDVARLQIHNETAKTASAWAATTAYAQAAKVLRSTGLGTEQTAGLYFVATTAGTSGGSEPTWDTTVGNTTSDGTVTWTCYAIIYYGADPASTGYSDTYTDGEQFDTGDTYRIRYADLNTTTSFKIFETTGIVSSTGFAVAVSPAADSVYAANAVDGLSTAVTNKFTTNYTTDRIVLDADLDWANTEIFAFYCGELTNNQGMYEFWGGMTAIDVGNYRINDSVVDILLDETGGFVKQTDSARLFRADGTRPAVDPTTGANGLEVNWRNPVYIAETGVSGLTAPESTELFKNSTIVTNLATVDANVDAILVDTSTTIPAQITALNDPSAADIRAEIDSNSTQLALIVGDTNELQADWADGGRLDVILDGKSTQVSVSSLPNATENADALLVRNLAGGSNGGRTIQDALRGNRNRVVIDSTAGTITVYEEDDTTVAWTGVAAFEARNAISSVDPS